MKPQRDLMQPLSFPNQRAVGSEFGHLLLLFTVASLPFWLLSHWFLLHRPLFSLDLLLAVAIISKYPKSGIAFLSTAWLIDGLVSQSFAFHFQSPLELLRSAQFATNVYWLDFLSSQIFFSSSLFLVSASVIYWLGHKRKRKSSLAFPALVIILVALDISNGSSLLSTRDTQFVSGNLAGSPTATLAVNKIFAGGSRRIEPLPMQPQQLSNDLLIQWARTNPNSSILFVVVESWGQPHSAPIRHWLTAQLLPLDWSKHFYLRETTINFKGATTDGELRSLCGLRGSYTLLTPEIGRSCIPSQLGSIGWATMGIHGFSGRMFSRSDWWPHLGLQHVQFAEDILNPSQPRCGGAFRGACDRKVIEIAALQARLPRHFAYALTLNSHLPLSPEQEPIPADLVELCGAEGYADAPCRLVASLGRTMHSVRDQLEQTPGQFAVLLVGDHAPPFVRLDYRALFASSHVPELLLLPIGIKHSD